MGHLQYSNLDCRHITKVGTYNEKYWIESAPNVLTPRPSSKPFQKLKLVYKHCRSTTSCLVICSCKIYYIVSKDPLKSRACVHFGTHEHFITIKEHCKDTIV